MADTTDISELVSTDAAETREDVSAIQENKEKQENKTDKNEDLKEIAVSKEKTEEKKEEQEEKKEEKKDEGPKLLDLAFAMDCTGSMGSYIHQAQQNIRTIVEEIVSAESADVRLALVEYRDHPPQDNSFVTRVNDFTSSVRDMKRWLEACKASGGGDCPEAVADALHQVLKLSWRADATKICVFISDAPPHGLGVNGDGFPNGCPAGLDPMQVTNQLAEKGVTLYLVGCEPSINPYKEFFSALAHVTSGQYVPLRQAKLLTQVIIGGAQEEMSLRTLMEQINQEVIAETANMDEIDEDFLSERIHSKYQSAGIRTKQLRLNKKALPKPSVYAENLSYCPNMADVRKEYSTVLEEGSRSSASFHGPRHKSVPVPSKHVSRKPKKKADTSNRGSGGGFLSWIFGSKSKEESPAEEAVIPQQRVEQECAFRAEAVGARVESDNEEDDMYPVEEDIYEPVEDNLDIAQVSRMVHRTVVSNKMSDRVIKKKPTS